MSQPQNIGSGQVAQPAPPPAAYAPAPRPKTDVSKPGLVIAVIALALALIGIVAFPGPAGVDGEAGEIGPQGEQGDDGSTGDTGLTGAQGPPGPSAITATSSVTTNADILAPCSNYPGAEVTIDVPSSGIIVVTSMVGIKIDHVSGTADEWWLSLSLSDSVCSGEPWMWAGRVSEGLPTYDFIYRTGHIQRYEPVSAGTYTFYVNGYMGLGGGAAGTDMFRWANTVAVFYAS